MLPEVIAEFLGTLVLILFGNGVVAMVVLFGTGVPGAVVNGGFTNITLAWGLAVTMAIYATGSISGTHANPAVTLALALYRKFSWRKVIPYFVAQVVGGVLGAALVYALYVPVIDHFNQAAQLTRAGGGAAGVFFTHPGLAITPMHAFSDEIILTAFLIFGIFAITEQYNEMAPQANSGALMIGLLIALIGASMGYLEAWALNPARDLGPRIFCFLTGWGPAAFRRATFRGS